MLPDLKELLETLNKMVGRPIFPFAITAYLMFVISTKLEPTEILVDAWGGYSSGASSGFDNDVYLDRCRDIRRTHRDIEAGVEPSFCLSGIRIIHEFRSCRGYLPPASFSAGSDADNGRMQMAALSELHDVSSLFR